MAFISTTIGSINLLGDLLTEKEAEAIIPPSQQKVVQGNAEGYNCLTCNEFYPQVELNYPDDSPITFRCYACRKGLK